MPSADTTGGTTGVNEFNVLAPVYDHTSRKKVWDILY